MAQPSTISPELLNSRLVRGEGVVNFAVAKARRDLDLAIAVFATDFTEENLSKLNAARDAYQTVAGQP